MCLGMNGADLLAEVVPSGLASTGGVNDPVNVPFGVAEAESLAAVILLKLPAEHQRRRAKSVFSMLDPIAEMLPGSVLPQQPADRGQNEVGSSPREFRRPVCCCAEQPG